MKLIFTLFFICLGSYCVFSQAKPELFILSVGVTKYQNPKYNLQFAHKDAIDLAAAFKAQTDLYDVRKVSVLLDEKATRANIRAELSSFKKLITPNDLFLFIFSGHGLNEALVTHDFNMEDRIATSLNKSDLADLVGQFNCNYVMLIDACHSGSFAKSNEGKDINIDFIKEQNIANEKLLRALNANDKANIVIGSSSSSEKSDECKVCENGYFTQSILDAFDGISIEDPQTKKIYMPDKDKNSFVYTNELDDYLKEVVNIKTRTNSISQSVISRQSPGFNFPLIKLKDSDGDGFADINDECKDIMGTANGCPDTDKDGVADKSDKCPEVGGLKELAGCPSSNSNVSISGPQSIGNVVLKSMIFPGWGDFTLNPNTKKIKLGLIGYGALASGFAMHIISNKANKSYNEAKTQATINSFKSKATTFNVMKTAFWGIAATAWVYDLATLFKTKNTKVALSSNGIKLKINI